jgi:hypothetical protein
MDKLEEAIQSPTERRTPPNFRIIVNVNQLVEMATIADTAGSNARAEKEKAAAAKAAAEASTEAAKDVPAAAPAATGGGGRNGGREARRAEANRRRERGGKIMKETLAEGDDRIEIDSRLTETGVRMRIRLEEGFVKIFGRLIAAQIAPQEEAAPS